MSVEVGRYLLSIISRANHRTSEITTSAIGGESRDIFSHLVQVLQIAKEEITYHLAATLHLATLTLHILLILLLPFLHVLNLHPASLTAVLHKLLEVSLNLVVHIQGAVAILGKQSETCRALQILHADV